MPRKSWWARLPFGVRMVAGTSALLIAIGGGVAGVSALTNKRDAARVVTAVGQAAQAAPPAVTAQDRVPAPHRPAATTGYDDRAAVPRTWDEADRTATRGPRRPAGTTAAGAAAPARPAVTRPAGPPPGVPGMPAAPARTVRTEVETREIPFDTRLVRDPALPRGARRVQAPGVPGEETLRYEVTLIGGRVADRRLLDTTVTRAPQPRVVAFGVRQFPGRHRGPQRRPDRDCRRALDFCVPLGRSAMCPPEATEPARDPAHEPAYEPVREPAREPAHEPAREPARGPAPGRQPESAAPLDAAVRDLALLDPDARAALEGLAC